MKIKKLEAWFLVVFRKETDAKENQHIQGLDRENIFCNEQTWDLSKGDISEILHEQDLGLVTLMNKGSHWHVCPLSIQVAPEAFDT